MYLCFLYIMQSIKFCFSVFPVLKKSGCGNKSENLFFIHYIEITQPKKEIKTCCNSYQINVSGHSQTYNTKILKKIIKKVLTYQKHYANI